MIYILTAFLGGAFADLSMPPFAFWPAMIAGLGALYVVVCGAPSPRRAFLLGWVFGLGYFLFGLFWIGNALLVEGNPFSWVWPLAVAGLPVALSFFPAFACYAARRWFDLKAASGFLAFSVLLAASEWLRGHVFTGFPWNTYGYAWHGSLPVMQFAAFGGSYFLSWLTLMWGLLAGFVFVRRGTLAPLAPMIVFMVSLLPLIYVAGAWRLDGNPSVFRIDTRFLIVQPNIAQSEKWTAEKLGQHYERLMDMSFEALAQERQAKQTVILWPETATTYRVLELGLYQEAISGMLASAKNHTILAAGILWRDRDITDRNVFYNSILYIDRDKGQVGRDDKSHLVPFGEYIPFKDLVPLKPFANYDGFTSGGGPRLTHLGHDLSVTGLICYEVIFPGSVTPANPSERPDVLLNVTNDGWYGDSPGPYQHLMQTRFRAIEEGLPVIRSANTGISAVIDAHGRVVSELPIGAQGVLHADLPVKSAAPPYARWKDLPLLLLLALTFIFACLRRRSGA